MSRPAAPTSPLRRSRTARQFCPTSAKPPHTTCRLPQCSPRPPAPPPCHFRSFSPLHPVSSYYDPRWLLSLLLLAGVWPLPARYRCFLRSRLPPCLRISSYQSPCVEFFRPTFSRASPGPHYLGTSAIC